MTIRSAVLVASASLAALVSAVPAMAQTSEPFTGAYVDAVGGWDRHQADEAHKDGFVYGAQAGYDFASGKVRFGPEIEATGSTEKGCANTATATICSKAGRDFFVGGRVGYVVAPKALVYLTGGYTNARYTGSVIQNGVAFSNDDDHSGARIGAGVEYAVTKNLFVKTEYRYSNYSNGIARNQVLGGVGIRF